MEAVYQVAAVIQKILRILSGQFFFHSCDPLTAFGSLTVAYIGKSAAAVAKSQGRPGDHCQIGMKALDQMEIYISAVQCAVAFQTISGPAFLTHAAVAVRAARGISIIVPTLNGISIPSSLKSSAAVARITFS